MAVATTDKYWTIDNSSPYACAMKTVAIPCIIAVPSILTVAPKGTVNEAIELSAPNRSLAALNVTGIVALLDEVLNANSIAGRMFINSLRGFKRVKR